jgi:hypothetical protein
VIRVPLAEVILDEALKPNESRDVIVKHVTCAEDGRAEGGNRWLVMLGGVKKAEMSDAQGALVFARLLADLSQGRVWIHHDGEGTTPVDSSSIRGCSCC